MTLRKLLAGFAVWLLMYSTASASIISLDFEGISETYPFSDMPAIENYYNGGTASNGRSGTDYGVEFSDSAVAACLNGLKIDNEICYNGGGNISRGGEGDPSSAQTGLAFLSGFDAYINIADGFSDFFSFFYAGESIGNSNDFIYLYEGLNGTGNRIAIELDTTPTSSACINDYSAGNCIFQQSQLTGLTDIYKSISFSGDVNGNFFFDDLSFGGVKTSVSVHAPPTLLLILSSWFVLLVMKRANRN